MSVAAKVSNRIDRHRRGAPFSISGFYSLGNHTSVQKAFSRLAKEGVVQRVSKGIYVRPKPLRSMPSIKTTASASDVARVWAREHGYRLTSQGMEAAYRLGFQTQAPMRTVFWSNGPSRNFQVGKEVVEVRHVAEPKLRWPKHPEGELLRGLLATPLEAVDIGSLKVAMARLSLSASESRRVVHKLIGAPQLHAWQTKLRWLEQAV